MKKKKERKKIQEPKERKTKEKGKKLPAENSKSGVMKQ